MNGPLGLRTEFAREHDVSEETIDKLRQIEEFDLSRVRASALRDGAPEEFVGRIENEFRRFLALPLLFAGAEHQFAPSIRVDLFWHAFILDTTSYRSFCQRIYGAYLDHVPGDSRPEDATDLPGFQQTLGSLESAFGEIDQAVWDVVIAKCNTCYFGSFDELNT